VDVKIETATSKSVPTACGMCYVGCGILARVENGVVVKT
jgi:anaerobic selenocysteine-containing dehydrogenase